MPIHGDDHVLNRTATGWVGSGNGGYRVHWAIPDIDLSDPANAYVVVDGEKFDTTD